MEIKQQSFFREVLIFAAIALLVVLPIRWFIAQPFIVRGDSMVPTFHSGDYLIIDQLSYLLGEPERNDVVVMRWPKDEDIYFIKRIIGLPGETVELHGTHIVIQRGIGIEPLKLEQPYLGEAPRAEYNTYTLGEGEYFVMGDNRDNSSDSRVWGALPRRDIIGRAFVRLFPFTSIEFKPGSIISTNAE